MNLIFIPYSEDEFPRGLRGDNSWTFGQVMPVILLAVPLINIFESLYHPGRPNLTTRVFYG